jgi:4a-hydroxytetrahydrobiopterin dehydratase
MDALSRQHVSDAVGDAGWRLVLQTLTTSVRAGSIAEALTIATHLAEAAGGEADGRLAIDVRHDRVVLTVQPAAGATITERELRLAQRIAEASAVRGLRLDPEITGTRSVQRVEIAIDAVDIPTVRPFWKAVLGYVDDPGEAGPQSAIVDPYGQGPAVWFQQMDQPRPQRNRIHVDVSVPHDEASRRMEATLAAGGRLVYDAEAPAFWVLADTEGNEACITTWQGRD